MRLRASVQSVIGVTVHLKATLVPEGAEVERIPDPKMVELVEQDGAIYLLRLDDKGQCIADTWHQTVEEAKEQANFEFGIEANDWKEIDIQH